MSSVLILGAAGSIGSAVASAYVNHGLTVYGLVRSQEKADLVAKNEIIPLIASIADVDVWGPVAEKVDIVVEAVGNYTDRVTSDLIFNKLKVIASQKPELIILYTSGCLVYADSQDLINENSPYNLTNAYFPIRKSYEELYKSIGAIVIQPAFLYGKQGSASSYYFKNATQPVDGQVTLFGKKDQYRSFVHSYDLGQLYLLAGLKGQAVKGNIFLGSSNYFKSEEVIYAIAKEAGVEVKQVNFIAPPDDDFYAFIYSISNRLSSKKAETLLGWKPTRVSLLDHTKQYLQAWNYKKTLIIIHYYYFYIDVLFKKHIFDRGSYKSKEKPTIGTKVAVYIEYPPPSKRITIINSNHIHTTIFQLNFHCSILSAKINICKDTSTEKHS
ncbi:hypothetical protein PPL_04050 [Heterostelium album PN500]|uniref:NAD-dependent epimerase/dehydratase domain-containing protein n=1 Tax=Heterostelium pallidum (strain ATCC 26659 / Pp 5 / PN500) TaxID=670386 RepID=D3B5W2_HETP5|nr:hypothetical protein PPL_04050 [Heterostelium album PN500]EFA83260.1 hypothetical protein PPL_04050 [Heterostelium album PN500]|eukprot:XP_020435377.1 hypothetical protein PPL_04050 [Heterostelium album PN500]